MIAASGIEARGTPPVVFDSYAQEARCWATFASLDERKCYMAAIWHTLSASDQTAFLQYTHRSKVA